MTRLELVKMRQSGRLLVGREALEEASRMRMFRSRSPQQMLIELRKHVTLKWMHQQHEMELSDGEVTHGFVGTPEW